MAKKTIYVNITYEIITKKSAANGEAEESGFEEHDREYSFRELVELFRTCASASSSMGPYDMRAWVIGMADKDIRTGKVTVRCYHFGNKNDDKAHKYWAKALDIVFG